MYLLYLLFLNPSELHQPWPWNTGFWVSLFLMAPLKELRKLGVKLDVAEQTAKDARSKGHATTGAMTLAFERNRV